MNANENGPEITITRAQIGDVSDLARLEAECFAVPWQKDALKSAIEREDCLFLVARCADECAGYVSGFNICGEVYLNNLAVAPSFRRHGIGEKLMREFISGQTGCEFITLEVRVSNAPAVALYEKLGFVIAGRRKNFYSHPAEDAFICTLNLL